MIIHQEIKNWTVCIMLWCTQRKFTIFDQILCSNFHISTMKLEICVQHQFNKDLNPILIIVQFHTPLSLRVYLWLDMCPDHEFSVHCANCKWNGQQQHNTDDKPAYCHSRKSFRQTLELEKLPKRSPVNQKIFSSP